MNYIKHAEQYLSQQNNTPVSIEGFAKFLQNNLLDSEIVYVFGFCPQCFAPGIARARDMVGTTTCANGHEYVGKDGFNTIKAVANESALRANDPANKEPVFRKAIQEQQIVDSVTDVINSIKKLLLQLCKP